MISILIVFLILQSILLAAGIGFLFWLVFLAIPGLVGGPPYVGSKDEMSDVIFALASVKPGEKLIDIGSGDGRLVIAAAKQGCLAIGYEINPFLVWFSRYKIWRAGLWGRAHVHLCDFWTADFSDADVVIIYGFSPIMERLGKKLFRELREGARIIASRSPFVGWREEKMEKRAYLYRVAKEKEIR